MLSFTLKEDMTAIDGNHWACTAGGTNGQTVVLSTPCTCENCSLICGLNHWQNCHSPWSCPLEALLSPSGRAWTCQGRLSSTAISTLSLAALLRSKQQIPRRGQDVREGVTHQRRVTQITDSLSMLHRPGPPASRENLLEMKIHRHHTTPTESKIQGMGSYNMDFNKSQVNLMHTKVWDLLMYRNSQEIRNGHSTAESQSLALTCEKLASKLTPYTYTLYW